MKRASGARTQNIGLAVDVIRRRHYTFIESRPRLGQDALAESHDLIVVADRGLEPIHGREILLCSAAEIVGELLLLGGNDLPLQGEDLAIATPRAPRPGRPLELHAREPVAVELRAERIESGPAVTRAAERRDSWQILCFARSLLLFEQCTGAGELLVLGARAENRERIAGVSDLSSEIGRTENRSTVVRLARQVSKNRERYASTRSRLGQRLAAPQDLRAKRFFLAGERGTLAHPRRSHLVLGLEVCDRQLQLGDLRLSLQSGEERIGHVLAQRIELGAQPRLRCGELGIFDGTTRSDAWIVQRLSSREMRVVRIVRRSRWGNSAGQRDRNTRDVGLVLRLSFDRESGTSLSREILLPQARLLGEQG